MGLINIVVLVLSQSKPAIMGHAFLCSAVRAPSSALVTKFSLTVSTGALCKGRPSDFLQALTNCPN